MGEYLKLLRKNCQKAPETTAAQPLQKCNKRILALKTKRKQIILISPLEYYYWYEFEIRGLYPKTIFSLSERHEVPTNLTKNYTRVFY